MTRSFPVKFQSGGSLSSVVDLSSVQPLSLQIPSAWTAADLTLQSSADGVAWFNVYDDADAELTFKAAASRQISLSFPTLCVQFVRFRSGTSATPVNQAAARVLTGYGVVIG